MHHLPDPNEIDGFLKASSHAIDLFKKLREAWPVKSQERAQIEDKIQEAETALKLSEAHLAKALGYTLCHCAVPPGIMLSEGFHAKYKQTEVFKCNKCGKLMPPQGHFDAMDENNRIYEEHRRRGPGSWMA